MLLDDLDKPLGRSDKKQFPLLPELTMIDGKITDVKLDYVMFKGEYQYVTDMNTKERILDSFGEPIKRKEFTITFALPAYSLPNGEPRKTWLRLGLSLNEKSKLTKFLKAINLKITNPTPRMIIDSLTGQNVKFQLANKPGADGKIYQNIVFETIRPAQEKQTEVVAMKDLKDIDWKE
jgi:hypothetical protein